MRGPGGAVEIVQPVRGVLAMEVTGKLSGRDLERIRFVKEGVLLGEPIVRRATIIPRD